jgi:hypothetical protein
MTADSSRTGRIVLLSIVKNFGEKRNFAVRSVSRDTEEAARSVRETCGPVPRGGARAGFAW